MAIQCSSRLAWQSRPQGVTLSPEPTAFQTLHFKHCIPNTACQRCIPLPAYQVPRGGEVVVNWSATREVKPKCVWGGFPMRLLGRGSLACTCACPGSATVQVPPALD